MTAKRKGLLAFLSIALVAVVAAGTTLAYLTGNAGEKTNVFTFSDNIRGSLAEPNWDPEDGKNLTPGMEIRKDPMITNTSENGVDEYAAIMVTFEPGTEAEYDTEALTDTDTARLLGLITIDWNDDAWTLVGAYADNGDWTAVDAEKSNLETVKAMNRQVWVHNSTIAPAQITAPLFNTITIHSDIEDADMSWLSGVVLNHTPDCWTFGTHDAGQCTITYKHHANCALSKAVEAGQLDADDVAGAQKGGSLTGRDSQSYTCDCTPAEQHEADCPSMKGTLKGDCSHKVEGSIAGFQITNAGAILQADQFTGATDEATVNAFAALFKPADTGIGG